MRRLLWTVIVITAILVQARVEADPLATASLLIQSYQDPITGVTQACTQATYDNVANSFGATTINFGDPSNPFYLGGLFCTGATVNGAVPGHCAASPDPTAYSFDFSALLSSCTGSPCVTPFVSDSEGMTNSSGSVYQALTQVFPGATYTFDGMYTFTTNLSAPTIPGCSLPAGTISESSGLVGFNVFVPVPTSTGSNVTVDSSVTAFNPVTNTTVTTPVSVTFADVTAAGTTQVTATSSVAGNLSSNFSISGDGYQAEFFDVSTTATVTPPITVCQQYQVDANGNLLGTTIPETSLRILHGEGTPPTFVDVTSSQDTTTHTICGTVQSLSPFVVAVALPTTGPCTTNPEQNCTLATVPLKAQLIINEPTRSAVTHQRDRLVWRWITGAPTATSDFGDPLSTESYALCAYDTNGTLTFAAGVPAGGTCQVGTAQVPCWKALGRQSGSAGFKYNDPTHAADGIGFMRLKPGVLSRKGIGTAHIVVRGRGPNLVSRAAGVPGLPTLPLSLPQVVQLQSRSGRCWEATYSGAGVKRNTATLFNGRAD